jgi:hypothetical protein
MMQPVWFPGPTIPEDILVFSSVKSLCFIFVSPEMKDANGEAWVSVCSRMSDLLVFCCYVRDKEPARVSHTAVSSFIISAPVLSDSHLYKQNSLYDRDIYVYISAVGVVTVILLNPRSTCLPHILARPLSSCLVHCFILSVLFEFCLF